MGIKLLNSSPYYAQANGQAGASNKGVIKLIKSKIDEYPRKWHTVLHEALWAYRMACHGATKVSPYHLVYGHEAILPLSHPKISILGCEYLFLYNYPFSKYLRIF